MFNHLHACDIMDMVLFNSLKMKFVLMLDIRHIPHSTSVNCRFRITDTIKAARRS